MEFALTSTPKIIFGINSQKQLPGIIQGYGSKVLLVSGGQSFKSSFAALELLQELEHLSIEHHWVAVKGEPSPRVVNNTANVYRGWKPDVVVAIGGGSVIDAGKAISAMIRENGFITDYLEGVGKLNPSGKKVPFIAVPTTAGTGSEVTKNAVITEPGVDGFKKSLRHENYVPNIALIDPSLTVSCSKPITAASGMDAFTQLLESFLSTGANNYTDALALEGMTKIIRSLRLAYEEGNNLDARADMSYGAMLSGITLANAGLGLVHGFAQPLGSIFEVPHGLVCGTLMASVNELTVKRIIERGNEAAIEKYYRASRLVSDSENKLKSIETFIDYLKQLTRDLALPKLSEFGIKEEHLPEIAKQSGLKFHPEKLDKNDLLEILKKRL